MRECTLRVTLRCIDMTSIAASHRSICLRNDYSDKSLRRFLLFTFTVYFIFVLNKALFMNQVRQPVSYDTAATLADSTAVSDCN